MEQKINKGRGLPGGDVVEEGIRALMVHAPKPTLAALLVSIGAPRLRFLGYAPRHTIVDPEKKLYRLLSKKYPSRSTHSLYNSWIRRLVSFERAASCVKPRI